jgi:hypothetical protein
MIRAAVAEKDVFVSEQRLALFGHAAVEQGSQMLANGQLKAPAELNGRRVLDVQDSTWPVVTCLR